MSTPSQNSEEINIEFQLEHIVTSLQSLKVEMQGFAAFLTQGTSNEVLRVLSTFAFLQGHTAFVSGFAPDFEADRLQKMLTGLLTSLESDLEHGHFTLAEQLVMRRLGAMTVALGTSGHGLELLESLKNSIALTLNISGLTLLPALRSAQKLDAIVTSIQFWQCRHEHPSCSWLDLGMCLFDEMQESSSADGAQAADAAPGRLGALAAGDQIQVLHFQEVCENILGG